MSDCYFDVPRIPEWRSPDRFTVGGYDREPDPWEDEEEEDESQEEEDEKFDDEHPWEEEPEPVDERVGDWNRQSQEGENHGQ